MHAQLYVLFITEDAYCKHINEKNPLGMGGNLAKAYGSLLHEMWSGNTSYTHPRNLKVQQLATTKLHYNMHTVYFEMNFQKIMRKISRDCFA